MPAISAHTLSHLADRIEKAYLRRWPRLHREYALSGVWMAAAAQLVDLNRADRALPLDPEFFVAAQPKAGARPDPWLDLARPAAARRYARQVRRVIALLRRELVGELRKARAQLREGEPLEVVLFGRCPQVSPLARYLLALRARRPELARLLHPEVRLQLRACPLYEQAAERISPPAPPLSLPTDRLAVEPTTRSDLLHPFMLN